MVQLLWKIASKRRDGEERGYGVSYGLIKKVMD